MTHSTPPNTEYYTSQLKIYERIIHPFKTCLLEPEILAKVQQFHAENEDANSPAPCLIPTLSNLYFSSKQARLCKLTTEQFQYATKHFLHNKKPLSMDLASILCALFLCHCEHLTKMAQREVPTYFLDLCSSPGMKLCIASLLFREMRHLRFVAVDISKDRLILTKKMFKQWNKDASIRLLRHDGTQFAGGVFERNHKYWDLNRLVWEGGAWYQDWIEAQKLKRQGSSAKSRSGTLSPPRKKRKLREGDEADSVAESTTATSVLQRTEQSPSEYDFVMIDAECTTDGSIKHVYHFMEKNQKSVEEFLMEKCSEKLVQETAELQRNLLHNGYKLLKAGGYLLYSTCSLMQEQNEHVVSWLLDQYKDTAQLVDPFEHSVLENVKEHIVCEAGALQHTIRFNPAATGTNGLFVAKIHKRAATS